MYMYIWGRPAFHLKGRTANTGNGQMAIYIYIYIYEMMRRTMCLDGLGL
jgi:hypothetical protein